jgi:energy-coupling factor transporter ATP-binding protein EcfA2
MPREKDFHVALTSIWETKPDMWYYTGCCAEAGLLATQTRESASPAPLSEKTRQSTTGALEALKGVNLSFEQREIVTVLGANRAGKSTLLRAISGRLPALRGRHTLRRPDPASGRSLRCGSARYLARPPGVFSTLTVNENLTVGAFTPRHRKAEITEAGERFSASSRSSRMDGNWRAPCPAASSRGSPSAVP